MGLRKFDRCLTLSARLDNVDLLVTSLPNRGGHLAKPIHHFLFNLVNHHPISLH